MNTILILIYKTYVNSKVKLNIIKKENFMFDFWKYILNHI